MPVNNSTLIIGLPKSGKTTFLAQLYKRIVKKKCRIKLEHTPENIKSILNACKRLSKGMETEPTPAGENVELIIPVILEGESFELVCPDYGGEQVSNITELMEFDNNWKNLTQKNDRWILFIRPGQLYHHYDISLTGYAEIDDDKEIAKHEQKLSDQYQFIELLQCLLYIRGVGVKTKIKTPKLLVVLTCWDELNTSEEPNKVILDKLPMFHHFINSIWDQDSHKTIGLSSQEFSLDTPEAQDKYLDELPETFGYLIEGKGKPEKDLTKLIDIALNL